MSSRHPKQQKDFIGKIVEQQEDAKKEENLKKRKAVSKQPKIQAAFENNTKYGLQSKEQKDFDSKLVDYIIKDLASFNSINSKGFLELVNFLNKRVTFKHRTTYRRQVESKGDEILQQVMDIIKKAVNNHDIDLVAGTTDIWTRRANDS